MIKVECSGNKIMNLTETEVKYLEGVRLQIDTLSSEQNKLFKAAQKTLIPHFDDQESEEFLFDYMFNGGQLPR